MGSDTMGVWSTSTTPSAKGAAQVIPSAVAAIFDLDHTLLTDSSGKLFFTYLRHTGNFGRYFRTASVVRVLGGIMLYRLRLLSAELAMDQAVWVSRGIDVAELWGIVERWFNEVVIHTISKDAVERIHWHREQGHTIVISSASSQFSVLPVADYLGVEHSLYTNWLIEEGKLSGKVERPYNYGQGKVARVQEWAADRAIDFSQSYFYTDHHSDLPLLDAVGFPHAINPTPRLAQLARGRGWNVLQWK